MPIEFDDVAVNKASIIERSIKRMLEEYAADPKLSDFTHIDALTLNLERACQAAIDLAFHRCLLRKLGMPQTSSDAFRLLERSGLIKKETAQKMTAMVGFRNVAIHEYQILDMDVLRAIAGGGWRSLVQYLEDLGLRIRPL
ncbi:MAG: hypothetical protein CVV51_08695 [Spirochaetae bacterium HGW-Spirochaetae-7]|jgi:uncharacterized protein YutE (UPF0331/DUF86 family)|nr:MAG: hypothetical protein CVV51_08695 [Spirochaetae bacterium HGW-Spirochaetae-7]